MKPLEKVARSICAVHHDKPHESIFQHMRECYTKEARAAIMALWEPTEEMWSGLARDLVMWDRGMPNQYGSTLYKHLAWTGRPIPDWLRAEIPDTDHTPPKGTVAVCIFRAMLEAALGMPVKTSAQPVLAMSGKDGSAAS